jgi:hypothetical protein
MNADLQVQQAPPRAAAMASTVAPSPTAAGGASAALGEAARRANAGPHASSLAALQAMVAQRACADCETVRRTMGGGAPVQRAGDEDDAPPVQRADDEDSTLPVQRADDEDSTLPVQRVRDDDGGLPGELRAGLEHLSGRDLSGVRVNYDSPRPAQLNAHAVAQGAVIDVGPGKEKHLAHEGWHAVQQMQNRVRPTMDLDGTPVNDDASLEREADVMGARALAAGKRARPSAVRGGTPADAHLPAQRRVVGVVQAVWKRDAATRTAYWEGAGAPSEADLQQIANEGYTVSSLASAELHEASSASTSNRAGRSMPQRLEDWEEPDEGEPEDDPEHELQEAPRLSAQEQRSAGGEMESLDEEKGQPESVGPVEPGIRIGEAVAPRRSSQTEENRTRLGLEIETSTWFTVQDAGLLATARTLVNRTLASAELLEFVIDDVQDTGEVQGEFRTRPLDRSELSNPRQLLQSVKDEISLFPLAAFTGNIDGLKAALTRSEIWKPTPALDLIGTGLTPRNPTAKTVPKLPQHVTHSIPLAGFLKLPHGSQELLLPGSGDIRKLEDLLVHFYQKVMKRTKESTLHVSTTGRTRITPNIKTGLDSLLGLLEPDARARVIARFEELGPLPARVAVSGGAAAPWDKADIPGFYEDAGISGYTNLPQFPEYNPQAGHGHLAAEEKLKPPLFDTKRGDVRVLVEHRSDAMVRSLNSAAKDRSTDFKPYLDALRELDDQEGDKRLFARWFPDATSRGTAATSAASAAPRALAATSAASAAVSSSISPPEMRPRPAARGASEGGLDRAWPRHRMGNPAVHGPVDDPTEAEPEMGSGAESGQRLRARPSKPRKPENTK